MSQHDMVLDNNPGATFRADANAALLALVTLSSGSTEPSTKRAGMFWLDTSITPDGLLRVRNQANSGWVTVPGAIGSNIKRTVITTSQTWAKPPGLKWLDVTVIGAGGGTGAAPITAAGQYSACSGAGGGGVSRKIYNGTTLAATVSITVGAAGAATPAAGSPTIFGGQNGGGGGPGSILVAGTQAAANGGVGGTASGGELNIPGQNGGTGWRQLGAYSQGGGGGASQLTNGYSEILSSTSAAGAAGTFPGGGARGAAMGASQAVAAAGALGGAGAVILIEYY